MAVTNEPHLTIRAPYPVMIRKDKAVTTRLDVLLGGTAPTISSVTYTLTSPDGTDVIDGVAATVDGAGAVSYAIGEDVLDDYEEGHRWTEKWVLTLASGDVYEPRREAALIRYELYCPVSGQDILDEDDPDLDDHLTGYSMTAQTCVDAAWRDILERLFETEEVPYQIVSSSAFRIPCKNLARYKAYRFLGRAQGGANKWLEDAAELWSAYERSWAAKAYLVDRDSDGEPDDDIRENAGTIIQPNAYVSRIPISSEY